MYTCMVCLKSYIDICTYMCIESYMYMHNTRPCKKGRSDVPESIEWTVLDESLSVEDFTTLPWT